MRGASNGEWFLSRRGSAVVARHFEPGSAVWTFYRAKHTARLEDLGLLGVERDSQGQRGPAPKGLKNLAGVYPGFLVFIA
jgi:hypothetical protein